MASPEEPAPAVRPILNPSLASGVERVLVEHQNTAETRAAAELLRTLIQPEQYVGEVYSLGYESALVLVHDKYRQQVGGIPGLSFLLATRVLPGAALDHTKEDTCVLLLRVMDSAPLPNHAETERIRTETAQRVSGDGKQHWDAPAIMDATTAYLLSYAGVRCRVIGTFYLEPNPDPKASLPLRLRFGGDLSNYYPNQGLKVYKPNGDALSRIVNFRDPLAATEGAAFRLGTVRYASTNRSFQGVDGVPVEIIPGDLLRQKTALFGMTRVGKSNTTKIILQAVFDLRFDKTPQRVGQLIFDPNGEYANDNVQDNRGAIRNVWRHPSGKGTKDDVLTFGLRKHPLDPDRRLMLLNFHAEANLQVGKEIIDGLLADQSSGYISHFRQVTFGPRPPADAASDRVRYDRRVLVYRSLLVKGGIHPPTPFKPDTAKLFNQALLKAMEESKGDGSAEYQQTAQLLARKDVTWKQLGEAFAGLQAFTEDAKSGYAAFNNDYMSKSSTGDPWMDPDLKNLLGMFKYPYGTQLIGRARQMHSSDVGDDYTGDIYRAVHEGKLVIIDQSGGDEGLNRSSAERIMRHVFLQNQQYFRLNEDPPDVVVYVEEAHNILPSGKDLDLQDIWVRTAKEGSKFRIGLVYATQEVSSIQRNILKNTANWFIGHLNNTDETKELVKYYDFEDFESSIRRAQDKGFLRVKTLSNLYVIPAQVRLFEAPTA